MKTQKLLIAVIVLQSLVLFGQWTGSSVAAPRTAEAQSAPGSMLGSSQRDERIRFRHPEPAGAHGGQRVGGERHSLRG